MSCWPVLLILCIWIINFHLIMLTFWQLHQFESRKNLQVIIRSMRAIHILWVRYLGTIEIMSRIPDSYKSVNVSKIRLFMVLLIMMSIGWFRKFKLLIVGFGRWLLHILDTETRPILHFLQVLSYYLIFIWSITHGVNHLVRDLFMILFDKISQLSFLSCSC